MTSLTKKTKIWCNNALSRRFGKYSFKENNENDMTFVVWAGIVFRPRLWQFSAHWRSLAGKSIVICIHKIDTPQPKSCYSIESFLLCSPWLYLFLSWGPKKLAFQPKSMFVCNLFVRVFLVWVSVTIQKDSSSKLAKT